MNSPLAIARRIMRGHPIERPLRDAATAVLARSALFKVLVGNPWALAQLDDATCAELARDVVEHVCAAALRQCEPGRHDWGGLPPWIDPRAAYDGLY